MVTFRKLLLILHSSRLGVRFLGLLAHVGEQLPKK